MTIPVWPTSFMQQFAVSGFAKGFPGGRLRTPMETGPAKLRRRFSAAPIPVSGAIVTNVGGASRFEKFWINDTENGTKRFLFPDQMRNGRIMGFDDGSYVLSEGFVPILVTAWWLSEFEDEPQVTAMGNDFYRISMNLNVLPA